MAGVNNITINVTVDDRGASIQEDRLEVYTVVLSMTVHLLSMLFGGAGNISAIIAIATRCNINRNFYAVVLNLFVACCICNFIYSPMEITDLILFHYYRNNSSAQFVSAKTAIYLFGILHIAFIIIFLSLEGIFGFKQIVGPLQMKTLSVSYFAVTLFPPTFLVCQLIITCFQSVNDLTVSYIITDECTRYSSVLLIASTFFFVAANLLVLLLLFVQEIVYWEKGRPRLKLKSIKPEIPELLISQSNVSADIDGGFLNSGSVSGTLYPTTPQLLAAEDSGSSSMSGEDKSHIFDVHKSKPTGNRLGINMAQVLGRRRHTICQISDASSEGADPTSRAKQYNYVRQLSVDTAALQAQLQNPKIYRDAPYQSDTDLSKKQSLDNTTLNSEDMTEHMSVPAVESSVTNSSDIEQIRKFALLTLYLSLTFLLTMVPVLVTEMFNSRLSTYAFMNISTCMLAVSTIQTVVYPHLVISSDRVVHRAVRRVVHRAVRKLKARIKMAVMCCSHRDISNHTEDSSSIDNTLTTIC